MVKKTLKMGYAVKHKSHYEVKVKLNIIMILQRSDISFGT